MKPPATYCPRCNGRPFLENGERCTCKRGMWYRFHPDYERPRERLFKIEHFPPRVWADRPGLSLAEQVEASIDDAERKYSMKERQTMSEKVTLATNIWQELALKWPDGKNLQNEYGESVMFSTVDDRVLFVPVLAAEKIRALGLKPGERLDIRKAEVPNGGGKPRIEWQVKRMDPSAGERRNGTFAVPKAAADTQENASAAPQSPESHSSQNGHSNRNSNSGNGVPPPPRTKLEDAIKTVIAALHSGNEYAKSIGFAMPQFTGEDLRCMVNTLIIQNGGKQ